MPSGIREDTEQKEWLIIETDDLKLISDYSHFNFGECLDLDCITYKILFRDAYIYKLKQTKEGRDFLEECYILTLTQPDKQALRNKYGGDINA